MRGNEQVANVKYQPVSQFPVDLETALLRIRNLAVSFDGTVAYGGDGSGCTGW